MPLILKQVLKTELSVIYEVTVASVCLHTFSSDTVCDITHTERELESVCILVSEVETLSEFITSAFCQAQI